MNEVAPGRERLTAERMSAFSDGVIAVIITVMVLDLKVPHSASDRVAMLEVIKPTLFYLLSFVQVGIYWVNHHYVLDDVTQVSHALLWGNLIFLFCLSLFPFATEWVGERGFVPFSMFLYSVVSFLPALAWTLVSRPIRAAGATNLVPSWKEWLSMTLYISAAVFAWASAWASLGLLIVVAVLWLVPPRSVPSTRPSVTR